MKMTKLVVTTALLTSLTLGGIFYAQTSDAANEVAPAAAAPAAATGAAKSTAVTQLPTDKAKLYNETMKQATENNAALRAQIQKAREEADAILTADKFDKKAYLAKATEMDQLYSKARSGMNEAFTSVAEKFNLAERKILLQNRNARAALQQK